MRFTAKTNKICPVCNKNFIPKERNNQYCGIYCQQTVRYKYYKTYMVSYRKLARYKKYARSYQSKLAKNNISFRINKNIRKSIWASLKGSKGNRRWELLVGYTVKVLIQHLENQFDDKMNWENYGKYWHVDHIKPQSLFIFKTPENKEFKKCWSLNNLQPLEKKENLKKYNHYKLF